MSTKDPAGSRVFREGFGKSHPGRLAFFVGSLYSEHPMDDPTGTHLSPSAVTCEVLSPSSLHRPHTTLLVRPSLLLRS